jgi:hypothetical protein
MGAIIGVTSWSRGQEKMRISSETTNNSGSTRSVIQTGDINSSNRYSSRYSDDNDDHIGGPFK